MSQDDDDENLPLMNDHAEHPAAPKDRTTTTADSGRATDSSYHDSGSSTPRFLQQQTEPHRLSKPWTYLPYPLYRVCNAVSGWARGPTPPGRYRIKPLFPKVQEFPLRLTERYLANRKVRYTVVFFYLAIWIVAFALVKRQGTLATDIADYGQPQDISCGDAYFGRQNSCGVDGNDCRPFNGTGVAFRCPANCASYHVLNPRAVGDQEVVYQALIVGGPNTDLSPELATYRGDSYICGAAVHAGIISNQDGGCGVVKLVGTKSKFISSQRNGITSIGFDSYFPLSFQFVPGIDCKASDSRWSLLAVSTVFSGILSLFTSSTALFFFSTFVGLFATTGLAMDPPSYTTVAGLVSNQLGRLLPALFCSWVIYDKMGVKRTLTGLTAQIEKTILWLGAAWVGALDNYTLDFIPIQRLNAHDLNQQPGAKAALSVIVIVLVVVVGFQVWFFRQEGRFIKYIKLYALLVLGIIIALTLPGLNLRIHHYILALLLLPGTSIQTRPSLLYQGLLVGLFINGISRWGFDSILQTSGELQADAQKGSLLPNIHKPEIHWAKDSVANITFEWDPPKNDKEAEYTYDGISVLVNDVERYRAYFEDKSYTPGYVWDRNGSLDMPEYFRFGFMMGSEVGDYTRAGVWTADGKWKEMAPGPSK